ncbi:MAG: UDP-N-acetylmuramate dehydrogenase [Deltaproteobacteria bacterium]|nr:UDP-N-acetylmuramate dehydrogenase [Deltaproteobacteria bacterium]
MRELRDEPLSRQGCWRVGGPMARFVVVDTAEELAGIGEIELFLGNGSNLLAPDTGLPGTVVRLGGEFRALDVVEEQGESVVIRAGAGLHNSVLLSRLDKLDLGGLGCLAGVPGTVGGAVAMNAGTALGEIAERLEAIEGWLDGRSARLSRQDLHMSYRHGDLPPGMVVTAAHLRVGRDAVAAERERVAQHLQRRKATQPLELPSCGSVFRNPPGDHAGRLVESTGLKGHAIGGARISERHANFIVNGGGATALDVMRCIRLAWDTVLRETGVRLVPEVRVVGAWPPELWPLPR